mmetsp:Transcript_84523/g.258054  ORF Transcript_84523/g.258054 Transcript_84523/m.258054 type:complete len:234 (-) Transcript_84523:2815-3516(-)
MLQRQLLFQPPGQLLHLLLHHLLADHHLTDVADGVPGGEVVARVLVEAGGGRGVGVADGLPDARAAARRPGLEAAALRRRRHLQDGAPLGQRLLLPLLLLRPRLALLIELAAILLHRAAQLLRLLAAAHLVLLPRALRRGLLLEAEPLLLLPAALCLGSLCGQPLFLLQALALRLGSLRCQSLLFLQTLALCLEALPLGALPRLLLQAAPLLLAPLLRLPFPALGFLGGALLP